jgi:hypothetical protein
MTHSKLLQHIPVRPLLSAAWILTAFAGDARAQSEADATALDAIRTAIAEGSSTSDAAALDAVVATLAEGSSTPEAPDAAALDAAMQTITESSSASATARGIQTSRDGIPVGPFPFGNFKLVTAGVPFSFDIPVAAGIARCATVVLGSSGTPVQTDVIANGVATFHVPGLPGGTATLQTVCVEGGNSPVYVNEPVFVAVIPATLTGLGAITTDPPDAPFLVWGRRYRFSAPVTGTGIQACTATLQLNDAAFNVPATYDPGARTVSSVVERNIGGERIIFSCRDNYERTITTRLELPPTSGVESKVADTTLPTTSPVRLLGSLDGAIHGGQLVTFAWDVADNIGAISCTLNLDDFSLDATDADRRRLQYTVPVENVTSGQAFYTTVVTPSINGLFNHGLTDNAVGAYVWCIDAKYNISATSDATVLPVIF